MLCKELIQYNEESHTNSSLVKEKEAIGSVLKF